eukprot:SAG11_NODE_1804_length_4234_cov_20.948730_3_plen_172_part_00
MGQTDRRKQRAVRALMGVGMLRSFAVFVRLRVLRASIVACSKQVLVGWRHCSIQLWILRLTDPAAERAGHLVPRLRQRLWRSRNRAGHATVDGQRDWLHAGTVAWWRERRLRAAATDDPHANVELCYGRADNSEPDCTTAGAAHPADANLFGAVGSGVPSRARRYVCGRCC